MRKLRAEQSYQIPHLSQYIESVCFYRNKHPQDNKDFLLEGCPEGVFELIIQSDSSVWQKNGNSMDWVQRDEAFVSGLHQQSFQLKLLPGSEVMSVRFRHGTFKYVFSGRMNDFINQNVPLSELWSQTGKQLHLKLKLTDNSMAKLQIIAAFLEAKVNDRKHSVIDQSVQAILKCQGMVDIQLLEKQSSLSTAQFRKRFREEVGLPPKTYAKVIKMNAIMNRLELNHGQELLTDVVYDFGYFDQSHFIKDFKSFLGKTPSQFIS